MRKQRTRIAPGMVAVIAFLPFCFPLSPSGLAFGSAAVLDIVSVKVGALGTSATMSININYPQHVGPVFLQVKDMPPRFSGAYIPKGQEESIFNSTSGTTYMAKVIVERDDGGNFKSTLGPVTIPDPNVASMPKSLRPNTIYYWAVQTTNKATGAKHIQTGQFRTMKLMVDISIKNIRVIDDSDSTGSGEMQFAFFVNKKRVLKYPAKGDANLSSGDKIWFGSGGVANSAPPYWTYTVDDAAKFINFTATGYDDDTSTLGLETCGAGPLTSFMLSGKNACGEWSSGFTNLDIWDKSGYPLGGGPGKSETYTKHFLLTVGGSNGSSVAFEVEGSYKVYYAILAAISPSSSR